MGGTRTPWLNFSKAPPRHQPLGFFSSKDADPMPEYLSSRFVFRSDTLTYNLINR